MQKKIVIITMALHISLCGMENSEEFEKIETSEQKYGFFQLASTQIPITNFLALGDTQRDHVLIASGNNVLLCNKQLQITDALGTQDTVQALLLLDDNRHLCSASGKWNGTVQSFINLWDLETNQCVTTYKSDFNCEDFAQFSNNEIALGLYNTDATAIAMWDFRSNKITSQWPVGNGGPLIGIQIAPDPLDEKKEKKLIIVSGYADDCVRWFEASTGVCRYVAHINGFFGDYLFIKNQQVISPDGEEIKIWDLGKPYSKEQKACLKTQEYVYRIANTNDGNTILSAGAQVVYVWDIANKTLLKKWMAQEQATTYLVCLPDNLVLTAQCVGGYDIDKSFNLWDMNGNLQAKQTVEESLSFASAVENDLLLVMMGNGENTTVTLWQITGLSNAKEQATMKTNLPRKSILGKTKLKTLHKENNRKPKETNTPEAVSTTNQSKACELM